MKGRRVYCLVQILALALALWTPGKSQSRSSRPSSPSQTRSPKLETVLPADLLAVVFIENAAQLQAGFRQSKFYRLVKTKSGDDVLNHYLRDVFDQPLPVRSIRLALVLVEPRAASSENPYAAVVAEVAQPSTLDKTMEKLSEQFPPPKSKMVERGGVKFTLTDRTIYGEPLGFARIETLLVYGQMPAVEKILLSSPSSSTLADSANFRLVPQRYRTGALFTFVNLERLSNYVLTRLVSGARGGTISILVPMLQFIGLSSLKALTLSTTFSSGVGADAGHLIVNWQQKGLVTSLVDIPAIEFSGPRVLPDNTVIYASFGVNLNQVYDSLVTTLAPLIRMQLGVQSVDEAITEFESQLGFKIKGELLASLGNELVMAYTPTGNTSPGQNLERVILFAVKNPAQLSAILEKVYAKVAKGDSAGGPPVEYKSYKIYPLDKNVSATALSDFLVISTTDQTKQLIDGRERGTSLSQKSDLLKIMRQKPAQAGTALYMSNDIFNLPSLKNILGGASGNDGLIDAARDEFPTSVHGFGQREETGVGFSISSPLGLVASTDLILASFGFDVLRKTKTEERQAVFVSSHLRLVSDLSRVLMSVQR